MKKAVSLFISVVMLTLIFWTGIVEATQFDIVAKSAILIDAETGQVLWEKDPHKKLPPASITKIMTLLLAMEAVERGEASLDDMVSISRRAESMGGSQIFLSTRDRLSLGTLLKAVTVASANDACVAVAEFIGGTEENFVRMMNQRAKELGMTNTNFVNTTGLPAENHYTTAYDIGLMSRKLIKYPEIREWSRIWHEFIPVSDGRRSLTNTNTLIRSYPGLDGIKTGHTTEAGFCLSASVERNGFRLISVVMNTDSDQQRNESTSRLLDFGFRTFEQRVVVKENEVVKNVPVSQGRELTVEGYAADNLKVVTQRGLNAEIRKEVKPIEKRAPIEKGEKIADMVIYQGEQELGRVDVLASRNVERANVFIRFLRWLGETVSGLIGGVRK